MIRKFDSYERAAMFVEEKRAEGFRAEIVNESVGFLWGSRTVGGFRVEVADEPGGLEEPPPQPDGIFIRLARAIVLVVLAVGVVAAIVSAISALGATIDLAIGIAIVAVISLGGGYLIFRRGFPSD
ncbi:MAG: hypothetical protein WD342_11340 [Verrucomicrobiales bacterium]